MGKLRKEKRREMLASKDSTAPSNVIPLHKPAAKPAKTPPKVGKHVAVAVKSDSDVKSDAVKDVKSAEARDVLAKKAKKKLIEKKLRKKILKAKKEKEAKATGQVAKAAVQGKKAVSQVDKAVGLKVKAAGLKAKAVEKRKIKLNEANDDEELTLDLVKLLGGDASDLKLLQQDDEKAVNQEEVPDLDPKGQLELKNLISSLKLNEYTIDQFIVKDKEETDEKANEKATEKDAKTSEKKEKKKNKDDVQEDKKDTKSDSNDAMIQENEVSSTTPTNESDEVEYEPTTTETKTDFSFIKTPSSRSHCVVKTSDKWFTSTDEKVSGAEGGGGGTGNLTYWVPKLVKYTEKVWTAEVANYETNAAKSQENKSEREWMKTVLKSGTLTDKMSAYVVQIQASPVHTFAVLENMLSLVSLKSRRPCLIAMDTLTQLLLDTLLIPNRKLRPFEKNPFHKLQDLSGGNKDTRDRYLISWLFEDRLKDFYNRFIEALEVVGKDTIENTRFKVISCCQQLLSGCPEQEQQLLSKLVNRLGDPSRAVASKAMHHLNQLIEQHPGMKDVMVKEVERLLYRPNINPKAQYYGICFLSQLMLERNKSSSSLATKLVNIYFSFFKLTIKKGEIDTKLMSALLTGVNRAFPYSALEPKQLDQQIETMHKLVHMVSFNISVQTLTLLYQIMDSRDSVNDRFYNALYGKILDPAFPQSSKQVMFLNLLFNSVRKDQSVPRVQAFIKRLLQCCEYLPSHSSAGVLFIISEIIRNRKDLGSLRSVFESDDGNIDFSRFDDSDDEEHYEDVKEEDQEVKTEEDEEGKAEEEDEADDDAGSNAESEDEHENESEEEEDIESDNDQNGDLDGQEIADNDSDSEEEGEEINELNDNFEELKTEDDIKLEEEDNKDDIKSGVTPGWVFKNNSGARNHKAKTTYDPQCRNPLFAGAERSAFWELESLVQHFHPTVQMFSKSLSENSAVIYPGDPLNDFTISKFLDRFVFRNPKKDPAKKKPTTVHGKRNIYRPAGVKALAPDGKDFVELAETAVPGDELFIHKYLKAKAERTGDKDKDDDNESVTSEDFNDFLDKMGGKEKDFDDEDIDFAGGFNGEDGDDDEDEGENEDDDDDDEKPGANSDNEDESEPEGLDGEDDGDFKDLSGSEDESDDAADLNMFDNDDDDEDINEEDINFSNEDDDEDEGPPRKKAKKKMKMSKKSSGMFDGSDLSGLLADAEEFSHLLDQNQDSGTSSSVSTKDKAGAKQLKWEQDRNQVMQGKRWGKKGGGKRPGGGGGSGGNRQGHSGKRPGGGGTSGKRPVGGGNRQADRRKQPPSKKARRR